MQSMGHIWYYSQNDRPVGPLSFVELKVALATLDMSQQILVWHDGLQSWQDVETFPDLLPVRKPSVALSTVAEVRPKRSFRKTWGARLATAFAFALALTVVRSLSQSNGSQSNIQAAAINDSSAITGKVREEFIKAGMATCLEKQENAEENKGLNLSRESHELLLVCFKWFRRYDHFW